MQLPGRMFSGMPAQGGIMKRRLSIRLKLFLTFLFLVLVSFGTLFYRTAQNLDHSLEEIIEAELESDLRYTWSEYSSITDQYRHVLAPAASSPEIRTLLARQDRAGLTSFIVQFRRSLPSVDLVTFIDPSLLILVTNGSEQPGARVALADMAARAFRERQAVAATELVPAHLLCREGLEKLCMPPPEKSSPQKVLLQTLVMPVLGEDGRVLGAIIAGDLVNQDARLPLQARQIFGTDVEISITQGADRVVSSKGSGAKSVAISEQILKRLQDGLSYRGQAFVDKAMFLTAFEPLKDHRGGFVGSISVALSMDSYLKIRHDHLNNVVFSTIIGVLLSIGLSWLAARQFTEPLRALGQSARRIEEGDLAQNVEVKSGDEIGALEHSFNRMAVALRERDVTIKGQHDELKKLNHDLEERVLARTLDLEREKLRLEAILTNMAEGVVVTNRENTVLLINPSAQKLFDVIPSRIVGKPLELLCESESFFLLINYLRGLELNIGEVSLVEERVTACGNEMVFRITPLIDHFGDFAGLVLSIRDITAETDLERMKAEFYTAVSHEFKTPLTSMKGSLELLLGSPQFAGEREEALLNICLRNTARLVSLTGEILDIARIGSGTALFLMEPVRINAIVDDALAELHDVVQRIGITIKRTTDDGLPSVFGDRNRLVKVFVNIFNNAIRFSPAGSTVEIASAWQGNYLLTTITDHGNGANRPGRFSPGEAGEVEGTGLGLALCQEIIKEHHGRIDYTTGADGGTAVTITLPVSEEP